MSVVWSPEAVADMEAAIEYLAERNSEAAERLARGIVAVAEHLASDPVEGPEHVLSNGDQFEAGRTGRSGYVISAEQMRS